MNNNNDDNTIIIDDDYDSDCYTDDDADFEYDNEYSDILFDESVFLDSEKQHNKLYIGCSTINSINEMVLTCCISASSFFKYPITKVRQYLLDYSIIYGQYKKIDIIKLDIEADGFYNVILKTYWIRLIQRHWKKYFIERNKVLKKRCSIYSINHKMIYGKYPINQRVLPGLNGLLQIYNK